MYYMYPRIIFFHFVVRNHDEMFENTLFTKCHKSLKIILCHMTF